MKLMPYPSFIGSLLHRQNLVRIFSYALNFMVGLSIFTGIAAIGELPNLNFFPENVVLTDISQSRSSALRAVKV